jgi:RimJ/RimL family protein N-acetyltransferase
MKGYTPFTLFLQMHRYPEPDRYIVTDRLLLRPWEQTDADDLYENANDEDVARAAGWLKHSSPEYSRKVIKERLSRPGTYAIVHKSVGRPIGSISLMFGEDANISLDDGESELGYWIGKKYWGNGYVPEAAKALIDHGMNDLKLTRIWCLSKITNEKSIRVQDKCGFKFVREGIVNDPIYGELTMRFTCIDQF